MSGGNSSRSTAVTSARRPIHSVPKNAGSSTGFCPSAASTTPTPPRGGLAANPRKKIISPVANPTTATATPHALPRAACSARPTALSVGARSGDHRCSNAAAASTPPSTITNTP